MKPIKIKTNELQLGDTICSRGVADSMPPRPWSTTIVVKIEDGLVHLWRPYGTTADFSYTGGVIPYVGIETYKIEVNDATEWTLYDRQELK
jgi:hypothetical protein